MRTLLVPSLALALLLAGAPDAVAAPPGINLGWISCNTATNGNQTFACDDNTLTFRLRGSFQLDAPVADFIGVGGFLEFVVAGGSLPPWWQTATDNCRGGQLAPIAVGTASGCVNPYSLANQGGGYVYTPTGPGRFRIEVGWHRDSPLALAANTHYSAFVVALSTDFTVDEGAGACPGCTVPACIVFDRMDLLGLSAPGGIVRTLTLPDVRNWATWQGGTGDCPGATPSRSATWGAVKALYR